MRRVVPIVVGAAIMSTRLLNQSINRLNFDDAMFFLPGSAAELIQRDSDITPLQTSQAIRVELHDGSVCRLRFDAQGFIIDPWNTPIRFEREPDSGEVRRVVARSAGPDRQFNTGDDIVSVWRQQP